MRAGDGAWELEAGRVIAVDRGKGGVRPDRVHLKRDALLSLRLSREGPWCDGSTKHRAEEERANEPALGYEARHGVGSFACARVYPFAGLSLRVACVMQRAPVWRSGHSWERAASADCMQGTRVAQCPAAVPASMSCRRRCHEPEDARADAVPEGVQPVIRVWAGRGSKRKSARGRLRGAGLVGETDMDVGALCGGLCRHGSGRQEREVKGARRRAGDSPVAGVQTTGQGLRMTGNTLLFLALPSRRSLAISRSRPARVNIGVRACPAVGRFSMHGCTSGLLRWWKTPQRYTRSPDDTASLQASHCTSPSGRPRKPRDVQNARSLPCRPPRAVRPAPYSHSRPGMRATKHYCCTPPPAPRGRAWTFGHAEPGPVDIARAGNAPLRCPAARRAGTEHARETVRVARAKHTRVAVGALSALEYASDDRRRRRCHAVASLAQDMAVCGCSDVRLPRQEAGLFADTYDDDRPLTTRGHDVPFGHTSLGLHSCRADNACVTHAKHRTGRGRMHVWFGGGQRRGDTREAKAGAPANHARSSGVAGGYASGCVVYAAGPGAVIVTELAVGRCGCGCGREYGGQGAAEKTSDTAACVVQELGGRERDTFARKMRVRDCSNDVSRRRASSQESVEGARSEDVPYTSGSAVAEMEVLYTCHHVRDRVCARKAHSRAVPQLCGRWTQGPPQNDMDDEGARRALESDCRAREEICAVVVRGAQDRLELVRERGTRLVRVELYRGVAPGAEQTMTTSSAARGRCGTRAVGGRR
ncbi:predicted protein [Postia placenta Mad-698-R]|nr:predicted protein [Postia placenta Mad-698-R]